MWIEGYTQPCSAGKKWKRLAYFTVRYQLSTPTRICFLPVHQCPGFGIQTAETRQTGRVSLCRIGVKLDFARFESISKSCFTTAAAKNYFTAETAESAEKRSLDEEIFRLCELRVSAVQYPGSSFGLTRNPK